MNHSFILSQISEIVKLKEEYEELCISKVEFEKSIQPELDALSEIEQIISQMGTDNTSDTKAKILEAIVAILRAK